MDYDHGTINKLNKMCNELSESDSELFDHIQFLRNTDDDISVKLSKTRQYIAKLEQQLNDLRKGLDGLKKTED